MYLKKDLKSKRARNTQTSRQTTARLLHILSLLRRGSHCLASPWRRLYCPYALQPTLVSRHNFASAHLSLARAACRETAIVIR